VAPVGLIPTRYKLGFNTKPELHSLQLPYVYDKQLVVDGTATHNELLYEKIKPWLHDEQTPLAEYVAQLATVVVTTVQFPLLMK
jgi:hypothetical protein